MASWFSSDGIGAFETFMNNHNRRSNPDLYETPKEPDRYIDYYVGIDLGLKRDHSALAVVEVREAPSGAKHCYVRYLKRFKLQTRYSHIAKEVANVDRQLKNHAGRKRLEASIVYVIDATGVGEGVAEIIKRAIPAADIYRVYLTGGINPTFDYGRREIHLPKAQMVSTLVALFDDGRIYLSKHSKELDAIVEELEHFEIKFSDDGNEQFSAARMHHDDLICSIGIAAYLASEWGSRAIMIW